MLDEYGYMWLRYAGYLLGWIDMGVSILTIPNSLDGVLFPDDHRMPVNFSKFVYGFMCIRLPFAVLLMLGIYEERHRFLLPWLILFGFTLIAFVVLSSLYLCILYTFSQNIPDKIEAIACVHAVFLFWLFTFFIFYVMYSLYKEIQAFREQQQAQFADVQSELPNK